MINKADKYYKRNLRKILRSGSLDENPRPKYKDGVNAHSKFITQVFEEYNIMKGEFPIPTLRNTAIKTAIREVLWIYQSQNSSLESARDMGVNWWDSWDIGDGTIGQRYGATVKKWNLIDNILIGLKNDPFSRRHISNMYQESDLKETGGLYPCAYEIIFSCRRVKKEIVLDMTLIQRSNDYVMAGYINKIQYVALQMMIAGHLGYRVGKFCHLTQNLHVYDRHIDAAMEILGREPRTINHPYISLSENKDFYSYTIDDFKIHNTEGILKIKSPLEIAI